MVFSMSIVSESAGGARWISVEPKGTMEQLGDFLSNLGLVTPGEQSLAVAGVILLILTIVWALSRPTQVTTSRRAPVSGRSGLGGAIRRGAPAAPTPLPMLPQGVTLERGDTLPLRPMPRRRRRRAGPIRRLMGGRSQSAGTAPLDTPGDRAEPRCMSDARRHPPRPLALTEAHVARVHRIVPDTGLIAYEGLRPLSPEDMVEAAARLLAQNQGHPFWVFGYGSLIWKQPSTMWSSAASPPGAGGAPSAWRSRTGARRARSRG